MQIRELVLYGYNGRVRHLQFALGKVNIITGRSKSGKSAIGDIIDYCMGGESWIMYNKLRKLKIA